MKKLNFGCGKDIRKGWVNVDIQKGKGIDKSFDFRKFPYPFKSNTFDYVLIDNVLEHLPNPQRVMKEIWRICKNGAIVKIVVPYYNSYYAYGDPTHVNFYNEYTIKQVIGESDYNVKKTIKKFEIIKIRLIPQRYLRFLDQKFLHILGRIFGNVVIQIEVEIRVLK
ncbi:MAG: methyltransferase domain-containing protein [Candidatus Pacearchaeota archaeon]